MILATAATVLLGAATAPATSPISTTATMSTTWEIGGLKRMSSTRCHGKRTGQVRDIGTARYSMKTSGFGGTRDPDTCNPKPPTNGGLMLTTPEIMRSIASRWDTPADAEDALKAGADRIEQLEARLERIRSYL